MVLCVSLSILWYVLLSLWVRGRALRGHPCQVKSVHVPVSILCVRPCHSNPPAYFSFDDNPLVLCK